MASSHAGYPVPQSGYEPRSDSCLVRLSLAENDFGVRPHLRRERGFAAARRLTRCGRLTALHFRSTRSRTYDFHQTLGCPWALVFSVSGFPPFGPRERTCTSYLCSMPLAPILAGAPRARIETDLGWRFLPTMFAASPAEKAPGPPNAEVERTSLIWSLLISNSLISDQRRDVPLQRLVRRTGV